MKNKLKHSLALLCFTLLLPFTSMAQEGFRDNVKGLHGILENIYEEMMPLCEELMSIGSAIAAFAALFYIANRVWRHLANAEPIDFYPLFRPFVIGFCVLNFTLVLGVINGIMQPIVVGTAAMAEHSNKAIEELLKQKEDALKETEQWKMYVGESGKGDQERWHKYTYEDNGEDGGFLGITEDIRFATEKLSYNFRNSIKEWMNVVLEVLFHAAALCINTLRTFQLIVLAILGPLVFGLAVFDGLQHTLMVWLARYINIYLWLPVANIFGSIIGKIQEKMIELDIAQIGESGYTSFFTGTDIAYLIFLIIGIVGYFSVPSIANYIVHAAGGSALQQKVTSIMSSAPKAVNQSVSSVVGMGTKAASGAASASADVLGDAAGRMTSNMADHAQSKGYFGDKISGK